MRDCLAQFVAEFVYRMKSHGGDDQAMPLPLTDADTVDRPVLPSKKKRKPPVVKHSFNGLRPVSRNLDRGLSLVPLRPRLLPFEGHTVAEVHRLSLASLSDHSPACRFAVFFLNSCSCNSLCKYVLAKFPL